MSSGELPAGTVSFLFTDIEGSTQLLKRLGGDRYAGALGDHQRILREAFAEHGGHEIDTQGDSFFVAFGRAKGAVSCAIACQQRLADHTWPEGAELRVRMGIHTGEPAMGGQRYVGLGVNRGARIAAAGHGGQVLVSQTTRELLRDDPVPDVSLRDLGEHRLKDMDEPERIYQLVSPGLRDDFPELKTAAPTPFEGREGELAEAAAHELAKRWRRPGRRTLLLATLGAAIVGAMLGVLLTQGGGSNPNAAVGSNAVGVIDPDGGNVVDEIPVGVAPGGIAAGAGSVWVTNTGGNTVSRIDLATNDVRQTIQVGGGPSGVAVSDDAVFVPKSPFNQNLSQFCDPALDAKMERAELLQTQDPPAATLLWQEVERDLLAQAPIVPATNRRNADFVSARVGNYQYNPQSGVLLSQLWVK